jgi:hypothetical protein
MRSASLIIFTLAVSITVAIAMAGCSQSLPPVATQSASAPNDFFWSARALDSAELDYSIMRNGATANHALYSYDNINVFDRSTQSTAFRIASRGDTISIDNIGANSLFSLPQGYFFAKDSTVLVPQTTPRYDTARDSNEKIIGIDSSRLDTVRFVESTVQRPGPLALLVRAQMSKNGSWFAGLLSGFGLGKGLDVTGRIIDHVDTLLVPSLHNAPAAAYGESYMVRYACEGSGDSVKFPIFWKVYYARSVGPVLIEEYADSLKTSNARVNLQSQAVLVRH